MEPTRKAEDFVEIYHSDSGMTAQRIVDVVLAPEGIDVVLHNRNDSMFPGAGQPGWVYLAVPMDQREKAVGLLDEARENGFLDQTDGAQI